MVCQFEITEDQLRQGLAAIEKAKSRGFAFTTAVFRISGVGPGGTDVVATHSDAVILKSHPTDPGKNWGNRSTRQIGWARYVDGVYVNAVDEVEQ